jgi:ferredoxin
MKVRVNRAKCKGYGLCVGESPAVFDLDESGKAFVVDAFADGIPTELVDAVRKAELLCPERAIELEQTTAG